MSEQECSGIEQQPAQIDGGDRIATTPQQPEVNSQEAATEQQQQKPRSGYARLRSRHYKLVAEKESLEAEYHTLRKEAAEWRSMYLELKADLEAIGCGKEMSHG